MITIQRLEDTIKFTFDNNPLYLHDGTIEVPVNSLSLLIDESDIATFLKADSNDIFLSCSLDELDMTKEELLIWYKENATDTGMSPEEVEEIVEEATENLFGYAEYDSQSTRINFKHDASGDVITYIDATDFVIDGMIDNVEIVTVQGVKYLKITFNTESGKEPILIPLSDIFDPENYYTKTETDTLLADKADSSAVTQEISAAVSGKADSSAVTQEISAAVSGKADSSAVTQEISAAVSGKADSSAVTQEISAAVSGKADTSAVTEAISAAVSGKADSSAVTQEISAAVSGKADTSAMTEAISAAVSGKADSSAVTQEISAAVSGKADSDSVYTKAETDTLLADKADSSAVAQEISAAVSGKADSSAVTEEISAAVSGKADSSAVTQEISAAVSGKADSSAVTQEISAAVSGKADTSAVTQEISAAVSGKVDTTDFNSYSGTVDSRLAEDEEVTAAGLNALNDKFGGLKFVKLTQAEYDALTVKDNSTLYVII